MILECPACETRFLVDSALIPAEGRDVKCAKCAHQWFVEADPDALPQMESEESKEEEKPDIKEIPEGEPLLEAVEKEPDDGADQVDADSISDEDFGNIGLGASVPSLHQEKTFSFKPYAIAASVLFLLFIVSSLYAFRPSLQSSMPGIYAMLGMPSTEGLVLADIEMRQRPSRNKARFVVEGKIINQSEEVRALPILRVAIADKAGNWITSREYEAEKELKPGEAYPFKASKLETAFVDRVDHLIVELGNGIELMLRK